MTRIANFKKISKREENRKEAVIHVKSLKNLDNRLFGTTEFIFYAEVSVI